MADTNISPNMNLPVPTVSEAPGPGWANDVNASLNAIDSHNHSAGQGVPINPSGININAELPMNNNNLVTPRSVNFQAQLAALALSTDVGCLYVVGDDLYYNDENGTSIRITQGGAVAGSTGTITGLPSGTASAAFAGATFTFNSATNTPATMAVGPLIIGAAAANPKKVSLSPSVSQPADYAITLPLALPAATSLMNITSAGLMAVVEPDNSSFGIEGGKYGVLNTGIGTSKISNQSVTNAKLAALNYGTSNQTSFSFTSTSFVSVTDLAVNIPCIGRPVMIVLTATFTGDQGTISGPGSTNDIQIRILRNSTDVIQNVRSGFAGSQPFVLFPSVMFFDTSPPVSTNTYQVQARVSGGTGIFTNCGLIVMEL